MALWTVVRPKAMKTTRRKGFVCGVVVSDGVSFAPARVCHFLTRGLVKLTTKARREWFVLLVCVCVCARSDFASKAARREHQTNFEELEGLIAMVSCLHETVLPAAHVGLLGISPCWQAPKEKDDVEETTAEALSGRAFLMVRASQFCVAPAGQSKLRSGGLREGSLTLACLRMCPLPQGSRNKAMDEALCGGSCLSGFRPFGMVGPGSFRRISMSLRGCLCRLN